MDATSGKFRSGDAEYFLFEVDAGGYPVRNGDVLNEIRTELRNEEEGYTDVVVLSHGWNTFRLDDGSIYVGNEVFRQMDARKPAGRKPLYVQVLWPSAITNIFSVPSDGEEKEHFFELLRQLRKSLNEDNATSFLNRAPSMAALEEVERDVGEFLQKHGTESCSIHEKLPETVRHSIAKLAHELMHEGARTESDLLSLLDEKAVEVTDQSVEEKYQKMRKRKTNSDGLLSRFLGPVWSTGKAVLFAVYDLLLGTFERRASIVGTRGVHLLLSSLMQVARPDVRFHLCGHSLGAHVVLSAAIGHSPGSTLSRKIHTVLLLQAACPSRVLAKNGIYRPIATMLKPVAGPILNTVYPGDNALKPISMFLPRALGRFGFERTWPIQRRKVVVHKMHEKEIQEVEFRKGFAYNLHASAILSDHVDLADRELYDLFWQAATIQMDESDFEVTELSSLPENYWEDINIRNKRPGGFCSRS